MPFVTSSQLAATGPHVAPTKALDALVEQLPRSEDGRDGRDGRDGCFCLAREDRISRAVFFLACSDSELGCLLN